MDLTENATDILNQYVTRYSATAALHLLADILDNQAEAKQLAYGETATSINYQAKAIKIRRLANDDFMKLL